MFLISLYIYFRNRKQILKNLIGRIPYIIGIWNRGNKQNIRRRKELVGEVGEVVILSSWIKNGNFNVTSWTKDLFKSTAIARFVWRIFTEVVSQKVPQRSIETQHRVAETHKNTRLTFAKDSETGATRNYCFQLQIKQILKGLMQLYYFCWSEHCVDMKNHRLVGIKNHRSPTDQRLQMLSV